MYLQAIAKDELIKYKTDSSFPATKVTDLSGWLFNKAEAHLLMSDGGERVGYCMVTGEMPDPRYSFALVEVGLSADVEGGLFRLIPNLVRSFKLQCVMTRSDDAEIMRTMAHYPFDFNHIFQLYELPVALETDMTTEKIKLVKAENLNPKKLLGNGDFDIFSPDVYNPDLTEGEYELMSGKKRIGVVVVQKVPGSDFKFVFPVVGQELRRKGWGATLVSISAGQVRKDGGRPIIVVKPEDEMGLAFINSVGAKPVCDLLRLQPKFHVSPAMVIPVEE